ncbi:MAG: AsmA-like C-terminal region-containing protein, partial [Schleiferiaceae bacterium]
LTLGGLDLGLDNGRVQIGKSDLIFDGRIRNVLNDEGMLHDLRVNSKQLDAGERMDSEVGNGAWTGPEDPNEPEFNDPYRVELRAGRVHYDELHLADVQAVIIGRGLNFSFNQALASLGGGQIKGQGEWTAAQPDGGHLKTQLQLQRVRLNTLLREVNNFNQTALTADNVDGILDATVNLQLDFDANYDWVPASLIAELQFSLENGRLRNVDALQQLARFAEVDALKDVRFAPVRNTIYISQQRVLIPEMLLENNALQLKVAGNHGFDQVVDYRFQLLLRELLGGTKPKRSKALDSYITEESTRGPVWVPIRATGPIDKLSIKLDGQSLKQDVKEGVKEDWNKQANEIKNAVKPTEYQSVAPEKKYQFEWTDGEEDTTRLINEPDRSRTQFPRLRRKGGGG